MSLTLASTTAIVAGVPAMLGFIPDESLVLITALTDDDGSITTGPLARIDLPHLADHADSCVRQFTRRFGDLPVLCVTGVVVHAGDDYTRDGSLPLRADVDTVVRLLAEHGFTDVDIVHVPAVAEGVRWRSYLDTDRAGVLPDPATTAAAATAVAAGHTIAASLKDLAARFTPAPEHLRARLQPRIADALEAAAIDETWHLAAHVRLARADAAIRAAAHGQLPADDAAIADLAATFATVSFRDALVALPDDTARLAAENLLLHLWRHSSDPVAGQLATVIAVHAYLRGSGTGVQIALENADPEQPLARLLSIALRHAVPPSEIRHVLHNASVDTRRTLLSDPADDQS